MARAFEWIRGDEEVMNHARVFRRGPCSMHVSLACVRKEAGFDIKARIQNFALPRYDGIQMSLMMSNLLKRKRLSCLIMCVYEILPLRPRAAAPQKPAALRPVTCPCRVKIVIDFVDVKLQLVIALNHELNSSWQTVVVLTFISV